MRILFFLAVLFSLSSCFLFRDYKKRTFDLGPSRPALALLAPKGFVREEVQDTAGIRIYSFQYPGGAVLYAAHLADTTYELQVFDPTVHQPLPLRFGGLVYKGQDENQRFYRELRQGAVRFGYRNVTTDAEGYFDSATNYMYWKRHTPAKTSNSGKKG